MNVSDLQQHLADLSRLLAASGAGGVAADLAAIRDGLAPFRDYPLGAFADFLVRAEAFSRGDVPIVVTPPPKAKPARTTTAKPLPVEIEPLARDVESIYERAASPDVTVELITGLITRLEKLSKDGHLFVAERIGLKGLGKKTLPQIRGAIQGKIMDRKGATLRASLADRS